ncbi:ASCH domain-containing protein [Desulfonatronum thioautotrophicum]|uniref:ASCH domain-containing protein n=1 Tax=Desulfonatronum thioautotrophicum TaxID=617001 RepID=UPI0005EB0967|nr:ASCH domain-containing protein [Desulfonatronum thioautotrophicum]
MSEIKRALSIRQPFAELILQSRKTIEYRTRSTKIRERVFVYASLTSGPSEVFAEIGMVPADLPSGMLVGTVEITGCTGQPGDYEWHLANPERLPEPLAPHNKPQPVWFYPFNAPT